MNIFLDPPLDGDECYWAVVEGQLKVLNLFIKLIVLCSAEVSLGEVNICKHSHVKNWFFTNNKLQLFSHDNIIYVTTLHYQHLTAIPYIRTHDIQTFGDPTYL